MIYALEGLGIVFIVRCEYPFAHVFLFLQEKFPLLLYSFIFSYGLISALSGSLLEPDCQILGRRYYLGELVGHKFQLLSQLGD